jgi:hypothetical protein
MTDTDVFGNSLPQVAEQKSKPRPRTNDMALIEQVLKVACNDGYALVGPTERVYRTGAKDVTGAVELVGVPAEEANAVHQLIDAKDLTVGGQRRCRYRNHQECSGRSVLVPTVTRGKSARWSNLHRPSSWS